ncbi:unnamed protein product [Protopolystoma xenopodis]|uniref:Uncharacterized protein n=1 Tax=Protopolystoma xenopodis TaxID=117903 RepID=A0A3S5FGB5_9PLAT|nr:unnamed protein product [Protopolystoma xenopodis]
MFLLDSTSAHAKALSTGDVTSSLDPVAPASSDPLPNTQDCFSKVSNIYSTLLLGEAGDSLARSYAFSTDEYRDSFDNAEEDVLTSQPDMINSSSSSPSGIPPAMWRQLTLMWRDKVVSRTSSKSAKLSSHADFLPRMQDESEHQGKLKDSSSKEVVQEDNNTLSEHSGGWQIEEFDGSFDLISGNCDPKATSGPSSEEATSESGHSKSVSSYSFIEGRHAIYDSGESSEYSTLPTNIVCLQENSKPLIESTHPNNHLSLDVKEANLPTTTSLFSHSDAWILDFLSARTKDNEVEEYDVSGYDVDEADDIEDTDPAALMRETELDTFNPSAYCKIPNLLDQQVLRRRSSILKSPSSNSLTN